MNPDAVKVRTIVESDVLIKCRNRALTNLREQVEIAIQVPLTGDHKFLKSYRLFSLSADVIPTDTVLPVNETIGDELPNFFVKDFDDLNIQNLFIGPSKGGQDFTPFKKGSGNDLDISEDILGELNASILGLLEDDKIITARRPIGMFETSSAPDINKLDDDLDDQIRTRFTIRKPRLINVHDHTNSMIGNFLDTDTRYLIFPLTDRGSINPLSIYRFSFYHRQNGDVTVTPIIQYYTNTGTSISETVRDSFSFTGTADENTDFNFFDLMIPDVEGKEIIPNTTRRIRIVLKLEFNADTTFEIVYPLLEHVFNNAAAGTYTFIPENPSSITYNDVHSSKLTTSPVGTNITFDSTKLFNIHIGRKLFTTNFQYSLMDSNIVDELRVLENFSVRGQTLVLRMKHHDLPPVMLGRMQMDTTNPLFDYHFNDMSINFTETT